MGPLVPQDITINFDFVMSKLASCHCLCVCWQRMGPQVKLGVKLTALCGTCSVN